MARHDLIACKKCHIWHCSVCGYSTLEETRDEPGEPQD